VRQGGAARVREPANQVTAVEDGRKAGGGWHSMAKYQIISYANPAKRARKAADFDKTFAKFIERLEELAESPRKVLGQKVADD